MAFTLKWGILATGGIAKRFVGDLLLDPVDRKVTDVAHKVVAVGSSSSVSKSEDFIKELNIPGSPHAHGNYNSLVNDKDVDIIYVATPHTHHYSCTKLALEAGKHVLCEKPFTLNSLQAEELIKLAKKKNLFLMEAVWTRYFPLVIDLQKMLFEEKVLGNIQRVHADLSMTFDINNLPKTHRLIDPNLGGGALLDVGVYALTWVFLTAFDDPRNKRKAPIVSSGMLKTPISNVDEFTNISLIFPESHVSATATTSLSVKTPESSVCTIQGEKGDITVEWPTYRPERFVLRLYPEGTKPSETESISREETKKFTYEIPGQGMFWEADECARCIRDGLKESPRLPLSETLEVMKVCDKVRKDNDLVYAAALESI